MRVKFTGAKHHMRFWAYVCSMCDTTPYREISCQVLWFYCYKKYSLRELKSQCVFLSSMRPCRIKSCLVFWNGVFFSTMPNQTMPCILEWRECNTRLHCLSAYGRGPIESEVIYFHRKASVQVPMNQCVFALLSSRCVFKLPGYHLGWIITSLVYIDLLMCCVTHGTHKRTGQCYRNWWVTTLPIRS